MLNKSIFKSAIFAVLVALAASGMFTHNAFADDAKPAAKEVKVKAGDSVEVEDGDTVVVDVSDDASDDKAPPPPKADKAKKGGGAKFKPAADSKVAPVNADDAKPAAKAEPAAKPVMLDDFTETKSADEVDTDSVVEVAVRGVLHPSGPAIGGTLGFSWRPANRVRIHVGFDASKGLLELKGAEAELAQFGFTAAVTRAMTRTVEIGAFGTMSWAYRDLVKEVSASFVGVGPGFRINKAGSLVFFDAAIPIGMGKKFANSDWSLNHSLQASFGFHF